MGIANCNPNQNLEVKGITSSITTGITTKTAYIPTNSTLGVSSYIDYPEPLIN